jgi:hypothetical protein
MEHWLHLQADTFSIVNRINVITGGASYNVGDPVLVVGGGAAELVLVLLMILLKDILIQLL